MDKEELEEGLKYIEAVEKIKEELGDHLFAKLSRILEIPHSFDDLEYCKEFYHKLADFYRNERAKADIILKLEKYYNKPKKEKEN